MYPFLISLIGLALALIAGYLWRRWRMLQRQAKRQLATLEFDEQRPELAEAFRAAAEATGKPRGLRWKQCELEPNAVFATDPATGELVTLVGATISFEAIEGGAMEDVEAVGNLRAGTAIFVHRQGRWTTDGRAVFNLEPQQTLARFQESLEAFPPDSPEN